MATAQTRKTTDPAPWQDWLTCWTDLPVDLTSLLGADSLDSLGLNSAASGAGRMEDITKATGPFSTLPSLQKTCGLFNSDLPGVALDNKLSPVPQDDVTGCSDPFDLIGLLGDEPSLLGDQPGFHKDAVEQLMRSLSGDFSDLGAGGGDLGGDLDLPSLPSTPALDDSATNFLEVFTDLSAQIAQEYVAEQQAQEQKEESLEETHDPQPMETICLEDIDSVVVEAVEVVQPCSPPPIKSRATLKRKAKTAMTISSNSPPRAKARRKEEAAVVERRAILASVSSDHDYSAKVTQRPCLLDDVIDSTPEQDSAISGSGESHCVVVSAGPSRLSSSSTSSSRGRTKEEKYVERRTKNNIASRRSRQTRKEKFSTMEEQAISLVEENEELERKIEQMEALAKAMKDALIKKMAAK